MTPIPSEARDLLEGETFAAYTTLYPDGRPHVTPVWIDYDASTGTVLVNTVSGRRKDRHVEADPRVAVCVMDPTNPYRYLTVEGRAERTTEGTTAHIDELARRYMGVEPYPHHGDERGPRLLHRIAPETVLW